VRNVIAAPADARAFLRKGGKREYHTDAKRYGENSLRHKLTYPFSLIR